MSITRYLGGSGTSSCHVPSLRATLAAVMDEQLTRRAFLELPSLALASAPTLSAAAEDPAPPPSAVYPGGALAPAPPIRQRPEWKRFIVLVWQYQNDVRRDWRLYGLAGLQGFHIDHGAGASDLVQLSLTRK